MEQSLVQFNGSLVKKTNFVNVKHYKLLGFIIKYKFINSFFFWAANRKLIIIFFYQCYSGSDSITYLASFLFNLNCSVL